eukprot:GILK01018853.1.p3 GENE.GILK01018853.1~~GILK01018853.1.p3  ORF type:complete len:104 (+),score=11.84 GILK01018853.1:589-900(+)
MVCDDKNDACREKLNALLLEEAGEGLVAKELVPDTVDAKLPAIGIWVIVRPKVVGPPADGLPLVVETPPELLRVDITGVSTRFRDNSVSLPPSAKAPLEVSLA